MTAPATRMTESFAGTVPVKGSDVHTFTVAATGQVDVTLTSTAPPPTIVMGLAVGTSATSGCVALPGASTNTAAGTTAQLSGLLSPNVYCVSVHDAGTQTSEVSYSVTVLHP